MATNILFPNRPLNREQMMRLFDEALVMEKNTSISKKNVYNKVTTNTIIVDIEKSRM